MKRNALYIVSICGIALCLTLVFYSVHSYADRHARCECVCSPDLVWKCVDGWATCVPNTPRSVKLEK